MFPTAATWEHVLLAPPIPYLTLGWYATRPSGFTPNITEKFDSTVEDRSTPVAATPDPLDLEHERSFPE